MSSADNKIESFYSIKDLTELLSVNRRSLWNIIIKSEIPYYRFGKRIIRIKKCDFDNWLKTKKVNEEPIND